MKKLLHTFLLFFAFTMVQAQTADDKAKAYYQEALKAFENRNYQQTIDYCKQVTDVLTTTNARIELLRIKSYYELGEYDKAKASIKTFTNLQASAELKNEALEYLVKVERGEKEAEEKRLAEQRRLEQKLAEEKRQREEVERKRLDDENRRKAEEQRREESGLLLAGKWKGIDEVYELIANLEREGKSERKIEIEEKGNVIKLMEGPFPSGGIEATLVLDQGDKKLYKGSMKYNGARYSVECTYNKIDKSLNYVLTMNSNSRFRSHNGTYKILY